MVTLYKYNPVTGEYIGTQTAQKRPNGEVILDVLNAATVAPPEIPDGKTAVWSNGAWNLVEDHRQKYDASGIKMGGTQYWLPEDTHETPARYMTELGALPDGALLEQPENPAPTAAELAVLVRTERDRRITACDWVITRSLEQASLNGANSLTEEEYTAWVAYRQALRDLPSQEGFPWDGGGEETPWPIKPQ